MFHVLYGQRVHAREVVLHLEQISYKAVALSHSQVCHRRQFRYMFDAWMVRCAWGSNNYKYQAYSHLPRKELIFAGS